MKRDDLYGLPLAEFVPARDALAKQLRAGGDRETAEAVKKLAKPTVAAWAANQVLRTQRTDARKLFAAGDGLTKATPKTMRKAIERHRAAVNTLLDAARGLLDPNGRELSDQTLERVQRTLHAASLDPALREDAKAGRLTTEHAYWGLPPGA